jgi:uncharacterized protein (DUF1778 family)
MASMPTSIRLTVAERRRIAAAARKRGLSPTAFIKHAALAQAAGPDIRLEELGRTVAEIQEKIDDELDYRNATAAWERHLRSGKPALKPKEVWRDLGV